MVVPDQLDALLTHFQQYLVPVLPTPGHLREAKQRAARVRRLLVFMGGIDRLGDRDKWARWIEALQGRLKPTTISNHLYDYVKFLNYLRIAPPDSQSSYSLSRSEIELVINLVLTERHALKPAIAGHRLRVLEEKCSTLLTNVEMQQFVVLAMQAIPASLTALDRDPQRAQNFSRALGLLAGYILTLTGCRLSSIEGLSVADVFGAQPLEGRPGYRLIRLGTHKTSDRYGPARFAINSLEHGWLLRFTSIRRRLPGYRASQQLVFFNSAGNRHKKITPHVVLAYSRLIDRQGATATAIRTAVTNVVKKKGTAAEQAIIMCSMGHGQHAREQYYICPPKVYQARAAIERYLGLNRRPVVVIEKNV